MTNPAYRADAKEMLTVTEVCRQLGVGRTKFYNLINKGELSVVNVNPAPKKLVGQRGPRRSIRVRQSAVDEYKDRNTITVAP